MAVKSPSRGYLVEFVKKPPEEIETDCLICFHVIFEPKLALCCGHSFCTTCISSIEEEGKPCPLCGKQIHLADDLRLKRTLNGYTVYCPNKDEGCEWTGELGQLETHLNRQESGATAEDSMKGCQFQVIQCGLCQSHRCERRLLSDHVSSGCPDVILECEYSYAGCEFKKTQRDMDVHMGASVGIHLSLVSKSTRSSLSQKDREIEELKAELRQLKTDLRQQKENNNTQMQEVRQQYAELSQEVQRQRARQVRDSGQWQKNHQHHWMWILLLIAVGGLVHGHLYQKIEVIHLKISSTTSEQNQTAVTNKTFVDEVEKPLENVTMECYRMLSERIEISDAKVLHLNRTLKETIDEVEKRLKNLTVENYSEIERALSERIEISDTKVLHSFKETIDEVEKRLKNLTVEYYSEIERVLSEKMEVSDTKAIYLNRTFKEKFDEVEKRLKKSYSEVGVLSEKLNKYNKDLKHLQNRVDKWFSVATTSDSNYLDPPIAMKDFQRLESEILYLGHQIDFPVLPVRVNVTQVEEIRMEKSRWFSVPFYTHEGGYKMRLIVYPDGAKSGAGSHISVSLRLMSGKYDDQLTWPLNIALNVTLLSPHRFSSLYTLSNVERVKDKIMAEEGELIPKFAAHRDIFKDSLVNKDTQLCFNVEKYSEDKAKSWWPFPFWK